MARKQSQARLTIPKDIWDIVDFGDYNEPNFGFFITNDSRVVITDISLGTDFDYEFIGKCTFDERHRFFVPKNVDTYLGEGDIYYFTTSIHQSVVYFYKLDLNLLQKRQKAQLEKLISSL